MKYNGILGHEFVGTVEKSSNSELVGKRVVGEINAGCGKCNSCEKGMERHCPNRTVLGILKRDGAFAEFLLLPEKIYTSFLIQLLMNRQCLLNL